MQTDDEAPALAPALAPERGGCRAPSANEAWGPRNDDLDVLSAPEVPATNPDAQASVQDSPPQTTPATTPTR